jgi:hypothetical protein
MVLPVMTFQRDDLLSVSLAFAHLQSSQVKPPIGLSTPQIFKALDLERRSSADPLQLLKALAAEGRCTPDLCVNDLEQPAFDTCVPDSYVYLNTTFLIASVFSPSRNTLDDLENCSHLCGLPVTRRVDTRLRARACCLNSHLHQ